MNALTSPKMNATTSRLPPISPVKSRPGTISTATHSAAALMRISMTRFTRLA